MYSWLYSFPPTERGNEMRLFDDWTIEKEGESLGATFLKALLRYQASKLSA